MAVNKKAVFRVKGMTRDVAASRFNSEFAYEIKNMRLTATDSENGYALTNEKGTSLVNFTDSEGVLQGVPIGQTVINNQLVVFLTTATNDTPGNDSIIKLRLEDGELYLESLYYNKGSLGFSPKYPIECLPIYENEEVQKIYWVDGKNQPRYINIVASEEEKENWGPNSFNFVKAIYPIRSLTASREIGAGSFKSGTIQYCITYYNRYGSESGIVGITPLYYISNANSGASPEDTVNISFNIFINYSNDELPPTEFSHIRVYSIHRSSRNGTPEVKRIAEISFKDLDEDLHIALKDSGSIGETIDPTELLFIGGQYCIADTIATKDGTLFLGNLKTPKSFIPNELLEEIPSVTNIEFQTKTNTVSVPDGEYYKYNNSLDLPSTQIKAFKYLETYRFGIQLKDQFGNWSSVIPIEDLKNTVKPSIEKVIPSSGEPYLKINHPIAKASWTNTEEDSIISAITANGYTSVRPVIVYPTIEDRDIICQGVLNPTVYNVQDRVNNAPFSQASWFFRPNSAFDINAQASDSTVLPIEPDSYEPMVAEVIAEDSATFKHNGNWVEFRHNCPIPSNHLPQAEIQNIYLPASTPEVSSIERTTWIAEHIENYFIDQSIVTLNSPDIEFNDITSSSINESLKLRIIGAIPIHASYSDINIQTSTPVNRYVSSVGSTTGFYNESPIGLYKEIIGQPCVSVFGWRSLVSGVLWMDELSNRITYNSNKLTTGFVVYPWQRTGSLNNAESGYNNGEISSKLKRKITSILRYSYESTYFDNPLVMDSSDTALFSSNEVSLLKLNSDTNEAESKFNYYGNIDKVSVSSSSGTYPTEQYYQTIDGSSASEVDFDLNRSEGYRLATGNEKLPYPQYEGIYASGIIPMEMTTKEDDVWYKDVNLSATRSKNPVSIKYKSTPHAVINLASIEQEGNLYKTILPTGQYVSSVVGSGTANSENHTLSQGSQYFWDATKAINGVKQEEIEYSQNYGYLWLGELYREVPSETKFGGTTQNAYEHNNWVIAGREVSLYVDTGETVSIFWEEGDTYFQRYDCLKTYPFTNEDENSVVDILSFMVETRVNIDGRYDRNRGNLSNFTANPTNFNLINTAYTQDNNYFNSRYIDPSRNEITDFPNLITWTKTKTSGEEVDSWTNITLAATLEVDGDKGKIRSIKRFNNSLLVFQDTGISEIMYNESVQISASNGVPIELANSGKVSGKRYLTDKIGCTNKWSICNTPRGIYFVDSTSRDLYLFNGEGINSITDKLGFHSWMINNTDNSIWDPYNFNNCVLYYDKKNSDVLLITKNDCLAFNETLNTFTSFYSYEKTPYFSFIEDLGVMTKYDTENGTTSFHKFQEGPYNSFFGEYKPFWTTIIANPNPTEDKIFNTLEFKADTWNPSGDYLPNITFDSLTAENEYQRGFSTLANGDGNTPSNLKKKFRIWRANIPRNTFNIGGDTTHIYTRDRMRNPWLKVKLSKEESNYNKTVLHDMVIDYFE